MANDYSCFVCTEDMTWPTLFHCGDHLACVGCVWGWMQQSYVSPVNEVIRCMRVDHEYTIEDLYFAAKLGKVKCPSCNRTGRCDENMKQLRVSPVDMAKHFPGFGDWSCPFCKQPKATKEHVTGCTERTYVCPNTFCKKQVKVSERLTHTSQCLCYRCPRVTCAHNTNNVLMTVQQFLEHQNQQHLDEIREDQIKEENEEDGDYVDEGESGEEEDDDDYYDSELLSSSEGSEC